MKANIVISTVKNDDLAEVIPDDGISGLSVLGGTLDEVTPDVRIGGQTAHRTEVLAENISRDGNDVLDTRL